MINTTAAAFEKKYQSHFGNSLVGGINTDALSKINKEISESLEDIETSVLEELPAGQEEEPAIAQPALAEDEVPAEAEAHTPPEDDNDKRGLMELHEINQVLNEIENGDDILSDVGSDGAPEQELSTKPPKASVYKPKYDDYSWLYESDGQPDAEGGSSIKESENSEELKSLIDEIIN